MGETIQYRNFEIRKALVSYSPATDWAWSHKDFDGAPDANDVRTGFAHSIEHAKDQIDEWHEERSESSREHQIEFIKSFGRGALREGISEAFLSNGEDWLTDDQVRDIASDYVARARRNSRLFFENKRRRKQFTVKASA